MVTSITLMKAFGGLIILSVPVLVYLTRKAASKEHELYMKAKAEQIKDEQRRAEQRHHSQDEMQVLLKKLAQETKSLSDLIRKLGK